MCNKFELLVIAVLSDPHRRAIYDCLGKTGLREQGWQVVQRTKTPREIREEYEQIARWVGWITGKQIALNVCIYVKKRQRVCRKVTFSKNKNYLGKYNFF